MRHHWDVSIQQAIAIQQRLTPQVRVEPLPGAPELIAGADVSYTRRGGTHYASVVVCRRPDYRVVEAVTAQMRVAFPYVPGLLSFREVPVLAAAFRKVRVRPDVVLVDGQGLAHPRGLGLACHVGLVLDCPCVGCAKSRLVGEYRMPGLRRGCRTQLRYDSRVVGTVLRTRDGVKPVFVSVGHRVTLTEAAAVVLGATCGFRLPEPIRQAHRLANEARARARAQE